jgi:N-hydroxyarylamine O-acetyltransferase
MSPEHAIDLDRYFARIGIAPAREPTRATLDALTAAHVAAIPFENLDVLLGRPIDLDLAAIEKKLVIDRRGGYCFEQNTLLLHVLERLGFAVRPWSARVRIGRPRDFTPARTHLFCAVDLDGERLYADVGVGGLSPTCALRLDTTVEQATPHEPRRIVFADGRWFHQARLGDEWVDVCEFTREEMPPIDRVVANWYTSAHPESHFKSRLVVARALPDGGRVSILNHELAVRARGGASEKTILATPDQLVAVLAEHFGLVFPPGTRFPCPGLTFPAGA